MISTTDSAVQRPVIGWARQPAAPIIEEAHRRFRMRMISGRGHSSTGDAQALTEEVLGATANLFCPLLGQVELTVDCCRSEIVIVSGAMLPAGPWAGYLYEGDTLLLYCLSAGATRAELCRACREDPVLAAAAHLLGSEIAFAVGRRLDLLLRAPSRTIRWQKIALMSSESRASDRCRWDPKIGHAFFTTFAAQESPVFITESGSFDPVHTVLGLFRQTMRLRE